MNMYYVWTATLLRGFKSNLEREEVSEEERQKPAFCVQEKKVSQ